MPRTLAPLVQGVAITDRAGIITDFFRFRWQELVDSFTRVPALSRVALVDQQAAIPTKSAWTTTSAGTYRIAWYLRKTAADGVSSSATVTLGWVDGGVSLTVNGTTITADAVTAMQSGSIEVEADANVDLTYALAYVSNTPAKMTFRLTVTVERVE